MQAFEPANKELWEGCLWLFPDDRLLAELAYVTLTKPPLEMPDRKTWVTGLKS